MTASPHGDSAHGDPPRCPHCDAVMLRMEVPPMAEFISPWIYVCFNDECRYFKRGWEWMESQYAAKSSYRYKLDPFTGETGPLPVWSADALRDNILDEDA